MSDKLTEKEIIQALPFLAKCCKDEYNDISVDEVLLGASNIINRQQAEIERLRYNLKAVLDERADHSEAIEEVICWLKEKSQKKISPLLGVVYYEITEAKLDNLVAEMVGDAE